MLKYLIFLFIGLLFIGCGGSEADQSSSNTKAVYLGIQSGPAKTLPVSINQKIVLNFTADILPETATTSHIYIEYVPTSDPIVSSSTEPPYPIGVYLGTGVSSKTVIITPYKYLQSNSTYRVIVTTDVQDIYNRTLAHEYVYYFQTGDDSSDTTAIELRATKPVDGDADVFVTSEIVMDFNKDLSVEPQYNSIEYINVVDSTGNVISGRTEVFNSLIKFIPASPLPYDTNITVTLESSLEDIYGNYFSGGHSWEFKTKSELNTPKSELGYKVLDTLLTNKASYFVRTVRDADDDSLVVVARQDGIDLYNVNYHSPKSTPTLELSSSFLLTSQIISLDSLSYPFVVVGTLNNGIYLLEIKDGVLAEHSHFEVGNSIYSYTLVPDRVYTMNPNSGLKIYDYNSTASTITLYKELNSSIVGEALDVVDTFYQQDRKIYVADYNGSVATLELNGTLVSKIDINGSVKQLFTTPYSKIYAVNTSGIINAINYDGSSNDTFRYDIPSHINDASVYMKILAGYGKPYYATDKGFIVANDNGIDFIVNSIRNTASVSVVHSVDAASTGSTDQYEALFVVSLGKYGTLELFNEKYDDKNPILDTGYTNPLDGSVDVSPSVDLTIAIDDYYLDVATLSGDKFSLFDTNTSSDVVFSFSTSKIEYSSAYSAILNPLDDLISTHKYIIKINSDISDMLGRKFNNGVDMNISFTVQ